jgi:hypothetical protein
MRKQQKIKEIVRLLTGEFPEAEKLKVRHSLSNVLEINSMTSEEMGNKLTAEDFMEGLELLSGEELDKQILEWQLQEEAIKMYR